MVAELQSVERFPKVKVSQPPQKAGTVDLVATRIPFPELAAAVGMAILAALAAMAERLV
jgi:hypothetical protein